MVVLTTNRLANEGLPLWNAVLCLDCEVISNRRGNECPVCNGRSFVSLARVFGGSLFAHREHRSQECGNPLFDLKITVDLRQLHAKDLTTTLERLTTLIGPRLAQDQATFHVDVKPSGNGLQLQSSLSFPERDAA